MNKEGTISLRLRKADRERWEKLINQIQSRYPIHAPETIVLRQLCGLEPATVVTAEDRLVLTPKSSASRKGQK